MNENFEQKQLDKFSMLKSLVDELERKAQNLWAEQRLRYSASHPGRINYRNFQEWLSRQPVYSAIRKVDSEIAQAYTDMEKVRQWLEVNSPIYKKAQEEKWNRIINLNRQNIIVKESNVPQITKKGIKVIGAITEDFTEGDIGRLNRNKNIPNFIPKESKVTTVATGHATSSPEEPEGDFWTIQEKKDGRTSTSANLTSVARYGTALCQPGENMLFANCLGEGMSQSLRDSLSNIVKRTGVGVIIPGGALHPPEWPELYKREKFFLGSKNTDQSNQNPIGNVTALTFIKPNNDGEPSIYDTVNTRPMSVPTLLKKWIPQFLEKKKTPRK